MHADPLENRKKMHRRRLNSVNLQERTCQAGKQILNSGKKAAPGPWRMMKLHGKNSEASSKTKKQKSNKWTWGTVGIVGSYSKAKTLLLDFDMEKPRPRIATLQYCLRVIGLRAGWIRRRRTVHGWHVEIGINIALKPSEQVAAQACLGSDLRREAMNLRRSISMRFNPVSPFWEKRWNLLYERKL